MSKTSVEIWLRELKISILKPKAYNLYMPIDPSDDFPFPFDSFAGVIF